MLRSLNRNQTLKKLQANQKNQQLINKVQLK